MKLGQGANRSRRALITIGEKSKLINGGLLRYFFGCMDPSCSKVVFVNLSMGAIGAIGSPHNSLLSLSHDLYFDKTIIEKNYNESHECFFSIQLVVLEGDLIERGAYFSLNIKFLYRCSFSFPLCCFH